MAEVNWIRGTINPPSSGEYYVICRVLQDINDPDTHENYFKAGEYEITGDWWDAEDGAWQSLGKDNPFWEVESWANVLCPNVPRDIAKQVRRYFGKDLKRE